MNHKANQNIKRIWSQAPQPDYLKAVNVAEQDKLFLDFLIASTLVILVFILVFKLDLNEKWLEWAAQYDAQELDELPLGLSALAFAMAWFSWRRLQDLKKINAVLSETKKSLLLEISHRQQAEKLEAEFRRNIEQNLVLQQLRSAKESAIQEMSELLMFAKNRSEFIDIAVRHTQKITSFPTGAIYEYQGNTLKHLKGWGTLAQDRAINTSDYTCWAKRRGRIYSEVCQKNKSPLCPRGIPGYQAMCVPILTPKGIWGVFHFHQAIASFETPEKIRFEPEDSQRLVKTISDILGLHIHNLVLKEQLAAESIKDPLTGVLNRRGLKRALKENGLLNQKTQATYAVLLFDIDHFKQFNDQYGHDIGDEALLTVAQVVNEAMLPDDIFCRHGGEEFVMILPNHRLPAAIARANQIRRLVAQRVISIEKQACTHLTVSIGLAVYPEDAQDYERLLKYADQALYHAKQQGRNQVVDYQQLFESTADS